MVDVAFTVGLNGLAGVQSGFSGIQSSLRQTGSIARQAGAGFTRFAGLAGKSINGLNNIAARAADAGASIGLLANTAGKGGSLISQSMLEVAKGTGTALLVVGNLAAAVVPLTFAFGALAGAITRALVPLGKFITLLVSGRLLASLALLTTSFSGLATTVLAAGEAITVGIAWWKGKLDGFLDSVGDLIGKVPSLFQGLLEGIKSLGTEAAKDPLKPLRDSIIDATQAGTNYAGPLRLLDAALAEGRITGLQYAQMLSQVASQYGVLNAATIAAKQQAAAASSVQGFLEAIGPLQQYQLEIQRLMQLQASGAITAQQFGQAQAMAAATAISPWLQVAGTIGQALGTLFEDNKAVAIAQAIINTLQGITAAIAQYPPPLSYTMAAAQAALGFAQVAKIQSTEPGSSGKKMALGGLVPGSGLGDKVSALLEPREFVVNRNAAQRFRPLLEEINSSPSRFAMGGSVGGGSGGGMVGGVTVNNHYHREVVTDDMSFSRFNRRNVEEMTKQIRRRYGRRAF